MYELEKLLVEDFSGSISQSENVFDISDFAFEFYYNSGRVDIIALTDEKELIAFEAKLTRWRTAINQAYRNSSFVHYSYVLIPANIVDNAIKHRREFERRGLGLCSISPDRISIEISAPHKKPLLPWLTQNALDYIIVDENDRETNFQKNC
ncbi:MAG: hypothetical protein GY940_20890 [bacterium]|nr:hypothetical protein [bacterium]